MQSGFGPRKDGDATSATRNHGCFAGAGRGLHDHHEHHLSQLPPVGPRDPIIVVLVIAAVGESPARQGKEIPARDESLRNERDHIVDVWLHRLFPDW
jgi:hypothetical protein